MKNFLLRIKKQLILGFSRRSGRNFFGRKTVFTQGGGKKYKRRLIDYKRIIPFNFILLSIEKQLRNTAHVGLICYENGLFSYILLSDLHRITNCLYNGFTNSFKVGSSSFLMNIPAGNFVHHVEQNPGCGATLVRSAGASSFIISKDINSVFLKMNSGWLLKFSKLAVAIGGAASNSDHFITRIKSAGMKRHLGFKPRVRGVAMNPRDHAHGGGEGRSSPPVAHKTPYGKLTKVPTNRSKMYRKKKRLFKIF